jgi:hypothetical protein
MLSHRLVDSLDPESPALLTLELHAGTSYLFDCHFAPEDMLDEGLDCLAALALQVFLFVL